MEKSKIYHVMTTPPLVWGIPKDFAMLSFVVSLVVGGIGGRLFIGALGLFVGTAFIALIFWVIGYFMTKKDPEFLSVWTTMAFKMGSKDESIALDGKRHYEP